METKRKWGGYAYTEKIDFKPNKVTKDKDGYYVMIKGTSHQEVLTLIFLKRRYNTY